MANKNLFASSKPVVSIPEATHFNEAGGKAYVLNDKAALCQLAITGCFGGTYYTDEKEQLQQVLKLVESINDIEFIAKLAIYARQHGYMKDMPALLATIVASKDSKTFAKIFSKVIDSPKMLRNFVQITRSGVTGRKSFGSAPKRLIQNFLNNLTDDQLFKADVGNDPSLQDIIKMVHPKPQTEARAALYAYILNKDYNKEHICPTVKAYEAFKTDNSVSIPNVSFQMLTNLKLTDQHWKEIAKNSSWTQMRMNLNTFARHNVFNDSAMVDFIAEKLQNPSLIKQSKVFPYQLFAAYLNAQENIPVKIKNALQKAAEISIDNIPEIKGNVYVLLDVSGSMGNSVSGYRAVASKVKCVDVAALFASSIMKKNPNSVIIPFDTEVHENNLNAFDSIMTNAAKLAEFGGGGTDCSVALRKVKNLNSKVDAVIYISDNESWADEQHYQSTQTMIEWNEVKKKNPNAKLINIDIQPYTTTQTASQKDILNIGGFSDQIFEVVSKFLETSDNDFFVKEVEKVMI